MATSFKFATPQIITFIITITSMLISISAKQAPNPPRPFNAIYAFGDSYTDTGNTRSNTGPSGFMFVSNLPYGSTFFHRPTNRYSEGRLVIDFAAAALSLPFLPPYLDPKADRSDGVNFAVAGSTAIIHSFFVKNNLSLNITPQSITTQLTWFNQFVERKGCKDLATTRKECEDVFKDALIWVGEIGANDYAYSFGSSVTSATIQRLAITSVTGFLQVTINELLITHNGADYFGSIDTSKTLLHGYGYGTGTGYGYGYGV